MKICIIMPASLVTKILQIDQPIKDFYSSGQKNGDVSVPFHPVWMAFPTISVPVCWPVMALHRVRNIVPFRSV